jgi:formylglycine-generating enzyme required for sulfatase activity
VKQVWEPKAPPPGAETHLYRCRIVSYADDMARHDCGDYCKPRDFQFVEDVDVDGDGMVEDDYVAYMPFSMTETLSMPNWPGPGERGSRLPERMNATMHPPFWDPRAEDHPLQGNPDESSTDSFLRNYITTIWKKADFRNGGDTHRVTFDETSRLASICTRGYWYGYDEVRMVVLDGDGWYISDMDQFPIPKDMKDYAGGRCFICYPTRATWAKWKPEGYRNDFDVKKATFARHEFKDIQAVGWHLAKVNNRPTNSHVKWYGFEADAVVHRPEQPSFSLDMATIERDDIPAFNISTCEIPYAFWKRVFRYGDSPINTLDARYTFARSGDMGSMRFGDRRHVQNEPVTNLTFYDMLAFANCFSQMEGKTPAYYMDPEFKTHFRNMHIATYTVGREQVEGLSPWHCNPRLERKPLPSIHVNWTADGYRLPTATEWLVAAGKVTAAEGTDGTQPVGQGRPNANGLYDVPGNVREMVWTYGNVFDPAGATRQGSQDGPVEDQEGPADAGPSQRRPGYRARAGDGRRPRRRVSKSGWWPPDEDASVQDRQARGELRQVGSRPALGRGPRLRVQPPGPYGQHVLVSLRAHAARAGHVHAVARRGRLVQCAQRDGRPDAVLLHRSGEDEGVPPGVGLPPHQGGRLADRGQGRGVGQICRTTQQRAVALREVGRQRLPPADDKRI